MHIGLYVKYTLFFQILMKLQFSRQIFEKYSNKKFFENKSSASGRTDRRTDMTKLIVACRSFTRASKNCLVHTFCLFDLCDAYNKQSSPPSTAFTMAAN